MKDVKVVIGANFGSEGKGLMTDYFCDKAPYNRQVLNVRFNGGSQAGHTVVTPEGDKHVFSHFGAGTFNENVTSQELQEYFITWFKMFFKHPGCYVEAFLNNTYGYFYYGDEPAWKYTKTESENIQGLINPAGFDIHHIESLHSVRTLVAQYESLLTHFPVISIFSSCAFFTWITILLFMLLWKKKEMKKIFLLIPVIVSLLVCFAGPLNGINDFRYMFPIAFILPVVLGIELYIIYGKEEKTLDRIKNSAAILFPLVLSSIQRIETISNAMELRGFGKHKKRTWIMARPMEKRDYVGMIIGIAILAVSVSMIIVNGGRYFNPFL